MVALSRGVTCTGRMRRNVRMRALVAACALATQGCSFVFVRPPPDSPVAGGPPRCTESRAAPIADTVLAGAALALFAPSLGAALSCSPNCAENAGPALSILSGAVLLATAGSAIYGFHETNRCAEARASWSEVNSTRPAPAGEGAADTAPPR